MTMTTKTMPSPTTPRTGPSTRTPEPKPATKIAMVIALLEREEGATIAEMTMATGWQLHSTRAMLTGLRKKGHAIVKSKRDDVTCYRIVGAA